MVIKYNILLNRLFLILIAFSKFVVPNCTLNFDDSLVSAFTLDGNIEKEKNSIVDLADQILFVCKNEGYTINNYISTDENINYFVATCVEKGLIANQKTVKSNLDCIADESSFCVLSDIPTELVVSFEHINTKTFGDQTAFPAKCNTDSNQFDLVLTCSSKKWIVTKDDSIKESISEFCTKVSNSCDLNQYNNLLELPSTSEPSMILEDTEITAGCLQGTTEFELFCSKKKLIFADTKFATSPTKVDFISVAKRCEFYALNSKCLIKFPNGVKVYEIPSNEERLTNTPVYLGDMFVYTCSRDNFVINMQSKNYGYIKVDCFSDHLYGDNMIVTNPECVQASSTSICTKTNLPDYATYDNFSFVNTYVENDELEAMCKDGGEWYNFTIKCESGKWESYKSGQKVTNTIENICDVAKTGCSVTKIENLLTISSSVDENVLAETTITGSCFTGNNNLRLKCTDQRFEILSQTMKKVANFTNVAEFCGYSNGALMENAFGFAVIVLSAILV